MLGSLDLQCMTRKCHAVVDGYLPAHSTLLTQSLAGNGCAHCGSLLMPAIPGIRMHTPAMIAPKRHPCNGHTTKPAEHLQILRKAEALFAGTPEEVTVLRAACACALAHRDVGYTLKRLRAIGPKSNSSAASYRAARHALAELALRERGDARAFIAAHLDVVRVCNDVAAHLAAGDAYLRVQVWASCVQTAALVVL